jgi:hypothetical protein
MQLTKNNIGKTVTRNVARIKFYYHKKYRELVGRSETKDFKPLNHNFFLFLLIEIK